MIKTPKSKAKSSYCFHYPVRSNSELDEKIAKIDALIQKYKNVEWFNLGKEELSEDEDDEDDDEERQEEEKSLSTYSSESKVKTKKKKMSKKSKYKTIVSSAAKRREEEAKEGRRIDPYAQWR